MRVLVTGAAGFVGSHVSEACVAEGWTVTSVDNFFPNYDPALKRRNWEEVEHACGSARPHFAELDLLDADGLNSLFAKLKPELVIHTAALAGVRSSIEAPALYVQNNIVAFVNLLEAMRETGCHKILFTSSSSVYGTGAPVPFVESQDVDHPISPYAATKRSGELLLGTWHELYGIDAVAARLFTAYGPRQRPDLAIHRFVASIHGNEPIEMYGDGKSFRDYTYVGDIVAGLVAAARLLLAAGSRFEIVNLGSSRPTTLKELITSVERACGREARIQARPFQPGDVSHTLADIQKAESLLGWRPQVTLEEGLTRFVLWWRERFGSAEPSVGGDPGGEG